MPLAAAVLSDGHRLFTMFRRVTSSRETWAGDVSMARVGHEVTVEVRDIQGLRVLRSATFGTGISYNPSLPSASVASVSSGGQYLLVNTPGVGFLLWDLRSHEAPHPLSALGWASAARLTPDGNRIVFWNKTTISMLDSRSSRRR